MNDTQNEAGEDPEIDPREIEMASDETPTDVTAPELD
jgi:hypothetical protein